MQNAHSYRITLTHTHIYIYIGASISILLKFHISFVAPLLFSLMLSNALFCPFYRSTVSHALFLSVTHAPLSLSFCHSYTCIHSYLYPLQTHQVPASIQPWHFHSPSLSLTLTHTHTHKHLYRHCDSSLAQSGLRPRQRSIPCWPVWVTVRGNHPLHHTSNVCSPVVVFGFFIVSFVRSLFSPLIQKSINQYLWQFIKITFIKD